MSSFLRSLLSACACLFALECGAATVTAADYRSSLLEVYGRYQGVHALRDACVSAFPVLKPANETAFADWQNRYRRLHEELEQRFALMVRAYSRDEKDYARNYGKYQGYLLKQRDEAKQALLLETRNDLEGRCRALPEFLKSRESDLEAEFSNEWAVLRQWRLPAR